MRLAAGLVGVTLVASGCSGESGTTRDEWVQEANAICAEYKKRFDALGTADELPQLARLLDKAIRLLQNESRELRRVDPPTGDEARVQQLLAHLEQATVSIRKAREAAQRGEEQAVSVAIGESDSAASQAGHIARDLGADACADPT